MQVRLRLWQAAFPSELKLDKNLSFSQLAQKFELSGADIMNVVQYVCLTTLARGNDVISYEDIVEGIKREFIKSGKLQ